jgi:hypothetical protein
MNRYRRHLAAGETMKTMKTIMVIGAASGRPQQAMAAGMTGQARAMDPGNSPARNK